MEQYLNRCCVMDGSRGIVRYVGEVPPTAGVWLGVEWDEKRGKHNGSHEGIKYFDCKAGYGSFVRPQKVNFGVDVVDALHQRYGISTEDIESESLYIGGTGQKKIPVEAVGFKKVQARQSQFSKLFEVGLAQMNIKGSTPPGSLGQLVPNIRHLDLTSNLLSSLEDVLDIVQGVEKLERLNIRFSMMRQNVQLLGILKEMLVMCIHSSFGCGLWKWWILDSPTGCLLAPLCDNMISFHCNDVTNGRKIGSIKALHFNRAYLTWNEVCVLKQLTPCVVELHLCYNGISIISHLGSLFNSIIFLNLEGNSIEDWREVEKLSSLPRLERLILNSNKLSSIAFVGSDAEGKTNQFGTLKSLSLNANAISEWTSINELNKLRALTEVRFKSNPVVEEITSFDARQEIIARISDAKNVNGSVVTVKERKCAEMAFLNKYGKHWANAGGKSPKSPLPQEFVSQFPRYVELLEIHGCPQVEQVQKRTLKEGMLSLTFRCPDEPSKQDIEKSVPETMTLQQLKRLLQKLLKVGSSEQELSYLSSKTNMEIIMDDNMRQLSYYSIASNDIVLVRWRSS